MPIKNPTNWSPPAKFKTAWIETAKNLTPWGGSTRSKTAWAKTLKGKTGWSPQSGHDSIVIIGLLKLQDNLGNLIIDNLGNNLVTNPVQQIGKSKTIWIGSGV